MNKAILALLACLFIISCKKNNQRDSVSKKLLTQQTVDLSTHKLSTYSVIKHSKYLIIFESGLGDDHRVWAEKQLIAGVSDKSDVLLYDRAGYGESENGPGPRNIMALSAELKKVIDVLSPDRKVILVGHSMGGMIIRDYAVHNHSKVAAILFIDPSHEYYNRPSKAEEDYIYNLFNSNYGAKFGGTQEARSLIENSNYMVSLTPLPEVPVIVLSSTKVDAGHDVADRQKWFDAHELLGIGVKDFSHIATTASTHYIMNDEPGLVLKTLNSLLSKLP